MGVRSTALLVVLMAVVGACGGGQSLGTLTDNAMASPELSFVEPVEVVEVEGESLPAGALSTPARFTTFFEFGEDQRDLAVEELLAQASEAGFELENQLPESDWPLAKYKAIDVDGVVLTITVSAMNIGAELT